MTWKRLLILVHLLAYLFGVILIIQIFRLLLGGSWSVEEVILALLIFNIGLTFSFAGYLVQSHIRLENRISIIDKKLMGILSGTEELKFRLLYQNSKP